MSRATAHALAVAAVGLALGVAGPAGATPQVRELLKRADAARLVDEASQVETTVETWRGGELQKSREYLVLLRDGRRSLVVSRTPIEKGQKVLMLADDFWLLVPGSQRPIRITPAQKLLGEASAGDIATMSFGEDYDGEIAGEEIIDGVPCTHLALASQRRGTTYTRVELYVAKADARPVRADLFLASDKMAKQATFTQGTVSGRRQVAAMTLLDHVQPDRRTVIRYVSVTPRRAPDEYFNPMFLARGELPE